MPWRWLVSLVLVADASAVTIERTHIEFSGRNYRYVFAIVVAADIEAVRAIVTDYDRLERLNNDVLHSEVIARYDDLHVKRRMWLNHCLLIFCFDLIFVENVEQLANGDIVTEVIPEESNFEQGRARWHLEALDGQRTRIIVEAEQSPKFWIPPVIGPVLIRRSFIKEVRETAESIDRLARHGLVQ